MLEIIASSSLDPTKVINLRKWKKKWILIVFAQINYVKTVRLSQTKDLKIIVSLRTKRKGYM